jgi:hypothetical protein
MDEVSEALLPLNLASAPGATVHAIFRELGPTRRVRLAAGITKRVEDVHTPTAVVGAKKVVNRRGRPCKVDSTRRDLSADIASGSQDTERRLIRMFVCVFNVK